MNIEQITAAIVAAYPTRQPLMLWGPPGVGKSTAVKEAARILGEQHKEKASSLKSRIRAERSRGPLSGEEDSSFSLIDLRLSLMDPVDLRGGMWPDAAKKTMEWLRPTFLPATGRGILFLDEIVQAPQSMQNCASQLFLDRRIGEHAIGDGWLIMGAGNRVGDRAAANSMPTHVANRLTHLYAEVDVDAWVRWALAAKVDIRLIAFIKFRRALLHAFDPLSKSQAFPSPRSWGDSVHRTLLSSPSDRSIMEAMVRGAVGDGPGAEFCGFLRVFEKMPSIDAILLSPASAPIPDEMAALFAVVTALASVASKDNIAGIATYFNRISDLGKPDFSIAAMKEISAKGDGSLAKTRHFIEWAAKHNHLIV
jgi:DNA polymerase III delta prime subunit